MHLKQLTIDKLKKAPGSLQSNKKITRN